MPITPLHNEKELLQRVAGGDKNAFKSLYDHYWNDLYTVGISFLKSPDWAQDIIQDTFFKLWIKRETLPSVEQFNSYLFIMARNEMLTALKNKERLTELHAQYRQRLPGDFLLPDNGLFVKELESRIGKAIAQLPPRQFMLYELTRQEGLSHDQIAQKLNISKKTVSNTLTKALNNIRQYLQEHGETMAWILFTLAHLINF